MAWVYHNKPPMGWPLDLSEPINDGLVGYWYMPEGAGNKVFDLSGNGNTGVFGGTPTWGSGKFGQASIFDGTDYIEIGDIPILEGMAQLTLIVGIKTTATGTDTIFSKAHTSNSWNLNMNASEVAEFETWTAGGQVVSAGTTLINDGLFHHIVGVYDGVNQRVYVDAIEEDSDAQTGAISVGTSLVCIGALNSGAARALHWAGQIEYVMIYNRALSASEIALLYRFPFYGFLNPDEVPVLDQYYTVAAAGIAVLRRRIEAA